MRLICKDSEDNNRMDSLTRAIVIGVPCAVVVLVILFPAYGIFFLLTLIILTAISLKVGLHTTPDPWRPVIYRWGQMHRLGPGGVIFLLPGMDALGSADERVDMRPLSQDIVVSQIASVDGESIYMNLELTWRMHPDVTRLTAQIKQTFLRTPEQRRRMIEQTVSVVARHLLLNYSASQLRRADLRENATEILRDAVNELLAPHGLLIDTIFWRGSVPSDEYIKAKLAIKIAHERLAAMIDDVALVRERLPDVSPGDFLTQQAWIDLLRRGVAPPMLPGLPYMPPPPQRPAN
jgi:regulator of protease activity HflC (stomatin/prohibitin superfamily)